MLCKYHKIDNSYVFSVGRILGRLFSGDFLHTYRNVFIVLSSAYAGHTEKTEACTCSCPPLKKPVCVDTACDPSCCLLCCEGVL